MRLIEYKNNKRIISFSEKKNDVVRYFYAVSLPVFLFFTLFLTTNFVAIAQQRKVEAKLDTAFITIGQQAKITLTATVQAQDTLIWTSVKDTITRDIDVVNQEKIDTTFDQINIITKILTQDIVITAFDSGYFAIPPFQFNINDSIYLTEPLLLQVFTVEVDTSKGIADIKEPYQVPFSLWGFVKKHKYYFGGGLLAILLAIAYYIWRKNRKEKPVIIAQPKPKIPAHKLAFKKLKELENRKLWQNNKTKQFHSQLSEIIREYIENRFGIPALESTTDEIMQSLRTFSFITDKEKEKLHQMLTLSDLVKFAKEHPLPAENEASFKNVNAFIHHTLMSERKEKEGDLEYINTINQQNG